MRSVHCNTHEHMNLCIVSAEKSVKLYTVDHKKTRPSIHD